MVLEVMVSSQEVVRDSQVFPALALPDTCYVLSFAVIMLNTSLHNPNVKDKPSVQRFTAMNRGINDGGDLPEDLLRVRGFF
jgi:Sec7-like guanine-nucleotide exchange factor